jgi:hypothetical protein
MRHTLLSSRLEGAHPQTRPGHDRRHRPSRYALGLDDDRIQAPTPGSVNSCSAQARRGANRRGCCDHRGNPGFPLRAAEFPLLRAAARDVEVPRPVAQRPHRWQTRGCFCPQSAARVGSSASIMMPRRTSTGRLVDGADTAALVLAAGVNPANGGADRPVGGARVLHRPGGGAGVVASVGVARRVPLQQSARGGCEFRFDLPRRLLASGSSETEQADRRLDRDCCSPWRCGRLGCADSIAAAARPRGH